MRISRRGRLNAVGFVLVAGVSATTAVAPQAWAQEASSGAQQASAELSAQAQEKLPIGIPQVELPSSGWETGAPIVQHDGAPVPVPFTPDFIGPYASDISSYEYGIYLSVIDGFKDLQTNHHEVLDQNLEDVIHINNTASPQRVDQAIVDGHADQDGVLAAVADALGPSAAEALRTSIAENRLPKTMFLLDNGYAARAGGLASSTFVEKEIFDYKRPLVVAPDRIIRHGGEENADLYEGIEDSASYPSGHTTQATWITTLLAQMLPEMGPQIISRGAESGESRIVLGVHYPLDVMGGRMMGQAAAADRWADPRMRDALQQAAAELRSELEWRTGKSIADLAAEAKARESDQASLGRYNSLMSYSFSPIYDTNAPMVVPPMAPGLIAAAHPGLNNEQLSEVLRQTASPAGMPLDKQSAEGSWERINLVAAWVAQVSVNPDGSVVVNQ